ncbi:sugar ABC transporter permease [Aquibacillus koreensis]|uniref:Sugar ABC transporter permease n=1 Tax=Aquibacillus koreensis TaxID=279446 RepID=A0A9X3WKG5_9BACI|nr:sugar ABC transporter permease [Aquibacillus koreensis]MCT2537071.1 sugar ABC transporter permease [Aquibacillus koreensis]MDC3419946.1 sugar ABC transporter permease [Aquibacillus koreensis]
MIELNQVMSDKKAIFFLVAPGFLILISMIIFPIGMSIYYGFTDWGGIGEYNFIGFENFKEIIFNDKIFRISLINALLLTLATIFIQHPIAIFLAILITHCGRFEKILRTILFIPAIISIVVTAKLWASIYNPQYGLLNNVLETIGLGSLTQDWLGNPDLAIWAVILVTIWQGFGYAFLLYYAGLKGVPDELYEAAKIDGANYFQLYSKVVIPLLAPMARVAIILAVITCLKQMEVVYLMTNGGPGDSTQLLGNYLYQTAFSSAQYGYGNAISVLFVIVVLIVTVILNKFLDRDVGEF